MAKARAFTAAAVAALSLGIGVNAVGFTVVNAAFLRGLPFAESHRLYVLSWQPRVGARSSVSHPDFEDWRARSRTFSGLAAFRNTTSNISGDRALLEQVRGTSVTANIFAVLRQQPLIGRDFASADDHPGAEPVALLSYRLWKNRYGSDANIVGRTLRVNGQPTTIVGVMPDGMTRASPGHASWSRARCRGHGRTAVRQRTTRRAN